MELRHLRAFVVVAEELSFRRAAERLLISQPPLSQQIKRLEREVGELLFDRDTRRVELTAAGRAFLTEARRAIEAADLAPVRAKQAAQGHIGQIRLAYNGPGGSYAVVHLARRLRAEHPSIQLDLVGPMYSGEVVDLIHRRKVDIGLVRHPIDVMGLQLREITRDAVMVLVPSGHRLWDRAELTLADIADEPTISLPSNRGSAAMQVIKSAFAAHGLASNIVQEAPDMYTVMLLVGAGEGIGFALETAKHINVPGVRLIPIPDIPTIPLSVAWLERNHDPALKAFLDLMDDGLAQHLDPATWVDE
ncbi:MAG TPA: LysR substrate-binding domain-containing protein [Nocardioides sp.]